MAQKTKKPDPEMEEFQAALLRSAEQAMRGEIAAVHTPDQIMARRRGRPAGTTKTDTKVSINLRLDPGVLAALRATGRGWQTRVNDVMREWLARHARAAKNSTPG
jgi:uncharacterized protein (DUF4415 family)